MPEDLTPQPPDLPQSRATPFVKPARPPAPGWIWLLFGLGPTPICALLCITLAQVPADQFIQVAFSGAVAGLVLTVPMLGGLALAVRFFHQTSSRIAGGLAFAALISVGVAGVLFAGCMCLLQGTTFH